ncbi:PRD domain-containing protein [Bacillus sp. FJAT-50079]|uniref:BglG family transcription antiterminator n=1 Tax=Bacillus sp. FJAT-50079 TaxID=2833577 RepID=UPI001BC996F8|nr:PRD domain-containing protein [Bacillus sp. FJAT-50079]MBS4206561.1 BglG family transcription antiterminator [Bacillus sp. FJAT-50079]
MPYFTRRQLLILNELFLKDTLTSNELALLVDSSVRTIKTEISYIRTELKQYGIMIESKTNKGYTLIFTEKSSMNFLTNLLKSSKVKRLNKFKKNNYARIFFVIRRLLLEDSYIKLDELANEMFISRSSLNTDMIETKKILKKYQLTVKSKVNYGIKIQGTEMNKRLCIAEYFYHKDIGFDYKNDHGIPYLQENNDKYVQSIESQLRKICEEFNIILSDFSLKNIAIHVLISIHRNRMGNKITVPRSFIEKNYTKKAFQASQILCERLNAMFGCHFQEVDCAYIFMHFDSKQLINDVTSIKEKEQMEVNHVLEKIFVEIKNNFDIDISKDETLRTFLALHIPQMIKRIRINMVIRNPVVHENLQRYLYATKVTISATEIIQKHYNVEISLDEFGYLVLYFNVALRNLQKKRKITIGLMSGRGRAETIMYVDELNENFSKEKYELINFLSKEDMMKNIEDIDILLSSYPIELSRSILQVAIENGNYVEKIREYSNKIDLYKLDIDTYFQPQYSDFYLEGKDKESVLHNLMKKLQSLDIIDPDVQMDVPFVAHEIGNNILHLQDLYKICHKPFCFIVVLKNPIIWDKDIIRVLFMIKTKRDGDHKLNILCDMFSYWTRNKEKVNRLIHNKSYDLFLKDIQKY